MTLREQLDARRAGAKERFSVAQLAVMRRANQDLRASGILQRALKAGDAAPEWELADAHGTIVRSRELLKQGALVLAFFRGVW